MSTTEPKPQITSAAELKAAFEQVGISHTDMRDIIVVQESGEKGFTLSIASEPLAKKVATALGMETNVVQYDPKAEGISDGVITEVPLNGKNTFTRTAITTGFDMKTGTTIPRTTTREPDVTVQLREFRIGMTGEEGPSSQMFKEAFRGGAKVVTPTEANKAVPAMLSAAFSAHRA